MSEFYKQYLALEKQLLKLQEQSPEYAEPEEGDICEQLEQLWYSLTDGEQELIEEAHSHRLNERELLKKRSRRREQLEKEGFKFATDDDKY